MTDARILSEIKDIYNDPPDYISAYRRFKNFFNK